MNEGRPAQPAAPHRVKLKVQAGVLEGGRPRAGTAEMWWVTRAWVAVDNLPRRGGSGRGQANAPPPARPGAARDPRVPSRAEVRGRRSVVRSERLR